MPPARTDTVQAPGSLHGPAPSTPNYNSKSHSISPHAVNERLQSSLPPSSPPSILSHDDHYGAMLENRDGDYVEEDPFGFLAMEKLFKSKKRGLFARSDPVNIEGSFLTGKVVRSTLGPKTTGVKGRKTYKNSPIISEWKPLPECPSSPRHIAVGCTSSSLAQKSGGRRLKTCREDGSASKVGKLNRIEKEPNLGNIEAVTSGIMKQPVGKRGRKKAGNSAGGKKRALISEGARDLVSELDHLNDEDREKFQREREERIKYYKRLDSYQFFEELVWTV